MKIVIIDREWPQTAYLVVLLARSGFEVVLASGRPQEPWGLGRYCRLITAGPKGVDDAEFLTALLRDEPADIVYAISETTMQVLWTLPPELTAKVFPQVTERQKQLINDRPAMYEFVGSLGVPVPGSMDVPSADQLDAAIAKFGLPMVLRGTQGIGGTQVAVVESAAEAHAGYAHLRELSPEVPFAQQYLTGQRCLFGGLFDNGRMLQWFSQTTTEAVRATGPSIRVRSHRNEKLTEYSRRLFENFGWSGLACAEYIRGPDGSYTFLEVNPRPWAAILAAHRCGVPLLQSFADYLKGKRDFREIAFPEGKDVPLFPQFLITRLGQGKVRLGDVGAFASTLAAAPWSRVGLMLHFARGFHWTIQAGREARARQARQAKEARQA